MIAAALPADDDADVRDAIATFTPAVIRIRELSAIAFGLDAGSANRTAVEDQIDSLVADIATRAERLSLTVDDLFRVINADLATSRADTKKPHGEFLRHLLDANTAAYGDRSQIEREIGRMSDILRRADDRCTETDRACAGFVAGWATRGETR